jgi:hypothetical protein
MDKIIEQENGLYSIMGVEIFSAGTWNGDKYEVQDLDSMIEAFKENEKGFRPPLKLGHDEKQKLLQNDGMPAAGWVGNVYRKGKKLVADFVDIPKKIAELIKNKSYRKVSSEIYWNLAIEEKRYPFLLGAVSLLGADNPGVMNLDDILGMFNVNREYVEIKNYAKLEDDVKFETYNVDINNEIGGNDMTEAEKALKAELEKKDAEIKKYAALEESSKNAVDELKKQNDIVAQELEQLRAEKVQAELKQFTAELKSENLCTPAMEKHIQELIVEPAKKEYSLAEGKTGSKQDSIKELLKLFKAAAEVNFEEKTVDGDKKKSEKASADEVLEKEIEKYILDNKCDYKTAYKAVVKSHKKTDDEDESED